MKKTLGPISTVTILYVLSVIAIALFSFATPTLYTPDSLGYYNADIYRSAGYPLFIQCHKLLFGQKFMVFLRGSQLLLNLMAIFFIKQCIAKTLPLSKWNLCIVYLLLSIPLVYEIKVANVLLSEAIAYPFYLFVIGNVLLFTVQPSYKKFFVVFLALILLIEVRGQFLFLVPVLIAVVFIQRKQFASFKRVIPMFILAALIPFIAIALDVVYHSLKHNKATTTPWTGIQIVAMPIYVSDEHDFQLFDSKEQQAYFKWTYSQLKKKKLLMHQVPVDGMEKLEFYYANYVKIANGTLNDDGIRFFTAAKAEETKVILNDKMASSLVIPLVKQHFLSWAKLYFQNVAKGMGTAKYLILVGLLLCYSLFKLIEQRNRVAQFIFIGTLLLLGNALIVGLAEPVVSRYVFYNNWVLIAIVLILMQQSLYPTANA